MFLGLPYIEWLGYFSSVIVVISLTMSSILKLRLFSVLSAVSFSIYSFVIKAYPVAILNVFIFGINIYHIIRIYSAKEYFSVLPTDKESNYINEFLSFYDSEIKKIFSGFEYKPSANTLSLYLLRNVIPVGIFIAEKKDDKTMQILVDYVIPRYRDFKQGKFLFGKYEKYFKEIGVNILVAKSENKTHIKYLIKMGFKDNNGEFVKYLN